MAVVLVLVWGVEGSTVEVERGGGAGHGGVGSLSVTHSRTIQAVSVVKILSQRHRDTHLHLKQKVPFDPTITARGHGDQADAFKRDKTKQSGTLSLLFRLSSLVCKLNKCESSKLAVHVHSSPNFLRSFSTDDSTNTFDVLHLV